MNKKIYYINGFDCANCAAKAEQHISKQPNVSYVRLDFAGNRLYITYKGEAWPIDKLKNIIAEVEDDPLDIHESSGKLETNHKVFNKGMYLLLGRIIFGVICILLCRFVFSNIESFNQWITFGLYAVATIILIYDVFFKLCLHIKNKENILDHNLLITVATIGAFTLSILKIVNNNNDPSIGLDEAMESMMVVLLFQIGRIIEQIATNKSKAAVMSAIQLRVDFAYLLNGDEIIKVKPEKLNVGDIIVVNNGDLIPVDGVVIEGNGLIDTSSLTGEYVPVEVSVNSLVAGGCLVKSGSIKVTVNKKYEDSTVAKIVELISTGGEKKSKADDFIAKFAKFYTPVIVILSLLVILLGGLISQKWLDFVYIGLEVLVTGCPCAIVISVPLAYFSAIGLASKNGIVVKGTNYLDELNNMGMLVTDKTGTLTHGSFSIQTISPNGVSKEEFMNYIYAAECLSSHPIGKAICHGQKLAKLAAEQKGFEEYAGLGVKTLYQDNEILAGNFQYIKTHYNDLIPAKENGTAIYCLLNNSYIGYLVLNDTVKEDAQPMVDLLHSHDIEIVLLTGDKDENAKEICNKLGIDRWHSNLLPEQKVFKLEQEMEDTNKSVAFIGDGINDAPSIIRSDIGIAMGGIGSDIAVENADIVIMNDDPAKVYDAFKIARMARNTSLFNITFALSVKGIVAILVVLQEYIPGFSVPMFVAVMADTGLTVLLVLNSLLLLYRKVKRKIRNHK